MAKQPRVFSDLYVNMVRAGESSGALVEVLRRMADHFEKFAQVQSKFASALIYPAFVSVVGQAPATKHVTGSNHARIHVSHDPRTGRILAIGVIDNLVKGAAGQAIQAFNVVHGLPVKPEFEVDAKLAKQAAHCGAILAEQAIEKLAGRAGDSRCVGRPHSIFGAAKTEIRADADALRAGEIHASQ